jgi:hypothetical protein
LGTDEKISYLEKGIDQYYNYTVIIKLQELSYMNLMGHIDWSMDDIELRNPFRKMEVTGGFLRKRYLAGIYFAICWMTSKEVFCE